MKLGLLLADNNLIKSEAETEIAGISSDSREIKNGFLFAAVNNGIADGAVYIPKAIENGAAAVLCKDDSLKTEYPGIIFIKSDNPNFDFAKAAAVFYPQQPENIAAITGTNGKTSVADFIRQVLTMLRVKAASIGTLGLIEGDEQPVPYANTTPGVLSLHHDLEKLSHDGYNYLAMETSSHGICQYRVGGVKFKVGGFTNLTQDHLDYHKTMEAYFEAKKLLFTEIMPQGATAVLNADIEVYENLRNACIKSGKKVISYGHLGQEIKLLEAKPLNNGQMLKIDYFGKEKEIFIPLAGEFQAMNVLCALGMLHALYGHDEDVLSVISQIHGAKGRLEFIGETSNGGTIYVDYAHTPDALENVIKAMRPHTENKLHVVFGCGGDRDKTKRPIMGRITAALADYAYVTDDNPRTENADEIRRQVMEGCPGALNIGDRKKAIEYAIDKLQKGDVLIIAGKGHETGQYINGEVFHFSDQEVSSNYITKK